MTVSRQKIYVSKALMWLTTLSLVGALLSFKVQHFDIKSFLILIFLCYGICNVDMKQCNYAVILLGEFQIRV